MTNTLFELAGAHDQRFSPFVWRTKYALAHIGQGFEAVGLGSDYVKTFIR